MDAKCEVEARDAGELRGVLHEVVAEDVRREDDGRAERAGAAVAKSKCRANECVVDSLLEGRRETWGTYMASSAMYQAM